MLRNDLSRAMIIPLFYWSKVQFEGAILENYGDLVSKFVVERLSGKETQWVLPYKGRLFWKRRPVFIAAGSIIQYARKGTVVWGSGIISREDNIYNAEFLAVRGPLTRNRINEAGYECPEVFGDPGLLLPKFFTIDDLKNTKVGVIPHYVDYDVATKICTGTEFKVIDLLTNSVERTTREIVDCELTLSSSLHGLIVSHSFGIPSIWVRFGNKLFGDDVKFDDYFQSVDLGQYIPDTIKNIKDLQIQVDTAESHTGKLPRSESIKTLQEGLIKCFPFKVAYNFLTVCDRT